MPNSDRPVRVVQPEFHWGGEDTKTRAAFADCGILMEDARCVEHRRPWCVRGFAGSEISDPRLVQIRSPRTLAGR